VVIRLALATLIAFSVDCSAIDVPVPCPETLETQQQAIGAPAVAQVVSPSAPDWLQNDNPKLARLEGIGFRTGGPDSWEILAPDSTSETFDTPRGDANRWTFAGQEAVWLTCHYRGTYLYLAYEMAREPMTCFSLVHPTPNDTMMGWCSH
jgi:hypothetical protein